MDSFYQNLKKNKKRKPTNKNKNKTENTSKQNKPLQDTNFGRVSSVLIFDRLIRTYR